MRAALALAVAGFLAEQLGEHAVERRALRQAMPVAAMRAGDVIVGAQRFAHAHGDGFFADVQVRQAGHQRARVRSLTCSSNRRIVTIRRYMRSTSCVR